MLVFLCLMLAAVSVANFHGYHSHVDVTFGVNSDIVDNDHSLRSQFEPMVQAFLSAIVSMDLSVLATFWSSDTVCSHDLFLLKGFEFKGFEGLQRAMNLRQIMVSDLHVVLRTASSNPDTGVAIIKLDESFTWNRNGQSVTLLDNKVILRFDPLTNKLKRLDWYLGDPEAMLSSYWTPAEKLFYNLWQSATPDITTTSPALDLISDDFTFSIANGFGMMKDLTITGKSQLLRLIAFMTTGGGASSQEQALFETISRLHKLSYSEFNDIEGSDLEFEVLDSDESHVCVEMCFSKERCLMAEYSFRAGLLHKEVITLRDPTLFFRALALSHMNSPAEHTDPPLDLPAAPPATLAATATPAPGLVPAPELEAGLVSSPSSIPASIPASTSSSITSLNKPNH